MTFEQEFADPPLGLKSRPLWFWNGLLVKERLFEQLEQCKASGYAGVGILPAKRLYPEFMSKPFLELYKAVAGKAAELGLKLCLYDDYWFPSGSAGGLLAQKYPQALWKRLDMTAVDVDGPSHVRLEIPKGTLMGAVAMNMATYERLDVTGQVREGVLDWKVPSATWKLMAFVCTDEIRGLCAPYPDHLIPGGLVDFLDPDAVRKYIELTYQAYYDAFPEHFGSTIDSAFYDEPTAFYRLHGRGWTPRFNEKFEAHHGFNPAPLYPALWFDIGPDTVAARNLLFGFRAELYSTGFPKVITEWCHEHSIQLTGHLDQEEVINPVGQSGDLIKALKYQDIPGVDEISSYGRATRAYKIISSAAYNYDHPLVMTETYGGMEAMPAEVLYKEAMDQAAKGINLFIPHAVWYDKEYVIFQPELSAGNATYGPLLPEYNRYIGRLHRMLQGGRHVADIGVLYPMATLQAGYHFGDFDHYRGEPVPPEADYMDLGEILALEARRDYTFIHPEVLEEGCSVDGPLLRLNNKVNWESYQVFIIPGSVAISIQNLRKIKKFHDNGGKVIVTTCLPSRSCELGHDTEVVSIVREIFETPGSAVFIPELSPAALKQALDQLLPVPDVSIETDARPQDGNLTYIHKVLDGRHIYFFANSSSLAISANVQLRGKVAPELWNPETGETSAVIYNHDTMSGQQVTKFELNFWPVQSLFVVSPET